MLARCFARTGSAPSFEEKLGIIFHALALDIAPADSVDYTCIVFGLTWRNKKTFSVFSE